MRSSCFGLAKETGEVNASACRETDRKKNEASLISYTDGLKKCREKNAHLSLFSGEAGQTLW